MDLCIIKYRPAVGRGEQNIITDGGILAVRSAQLGAASGKEQYLNAGAAVRQFVLQKMQTIVLGREGYTVMKIGLVAVGHPDYNAAGDIDLLQGEVQKALLDRGVLFYDAGIAYSIAGAREAGKALAGANVDGVVMLLASWMECSVTMALYREIEHLPLCMWGFPMWTEQGQEKSTGSYVSYTMFKGVLDRLGRSYKGVLGAPEEAADEVVRFSKVANAYQRLKRCSVGLVGYTAMSIYTGTFDHVLMRAIVGPEIQHIDSYSLIRRAEKQSLEARQAVAARLRTMACVRADVTEESLLKAAGLYLALMELRQELSLDAVNVKCQYEFSKEYAMTMCVPLSLAADDGLLCSCEGDILCTVSMLILGYLTGQTIAYGDAINHTGNTLKLSPCGFMPFALGHGKKEITNFMPNCGFSGIQASFVMKPGRVTVIRLVEDIGGYHIVYFTGEGLETQKRQGWMPALDVLLDGRMEDLLDHYSGQHYAICYGDVTREIEMLAKLLKVPTVRI